MSKPNVDKLNLRLDQFRESDRQQEKRFWEEQQIEAQKTSAMVVSSLKWPLQKATIDDYHKWLKGFLSTGRRSTHSYQYKMPIHDWRVAIANFAVHPLHGSHVLHIIVPEGITVDYLSRGLGHINLYQMQEFGQVGGWVPIYEDTILKEDSNQ